MRNWTFVSINPPKPGHYMVYIDQAASNTPDTIQVRYWDGKVWDQIGREQTVTHWRDRCPPPKGTWMEKVGRKKRRRSACSAG